VSSGFEMLDEFDFHAIGRDEINDSVRELIRLGAEETANAAFFAVSADEVARRIGARVGV
jgi:hypothetical protein